MNFVERILPQLTAEPSVAAGGGFSTQTLLTMDSGAAVRHGPELAKICQIARNRPILAGTGNVIYITLRNDYEMAAVR